MLVWVLDSSGALRLDVLLKRRSLSRGALAVNFDRRA
jgi:hypothetical protein